MQRFLRVLGSFIVLFYTVTALPALASPRIQRFKARPPIHIYGAGKATPAGLTPTQIKSVYQLPADGGSGTIALIGAFDAVTIEKDLATFNATFSLPACTTKNSCFEKKKMSPAIARNSGWAMETALDVEWAHAIAPRAKILLVEAKSGSGKDLLDAVDYARSRRDVVAVSMSWGGAEFAEETTYDTAFISAYGATFFASSGDSGAGTSWPAASPNVVAVGGTSLTFGSDRTTLAKETAWSGSGGGVSLYEPQPLYQQEYSIRRANGKRAVPDVSYNANPRSGYSVYFSGGSRGRGWYTVGGTSAGAPQWAAIKALGLSATNTLFYKDKASATSGKFFRDIVSGSNGDCAYFCDARRRYDYVTGLGSPLTVKF